MVADVGFSKAHPLDRNAQFHQLMHRIYASAHFKRLLLLGVGVNVQEGIAGGDNMVGGVHVGGGVDVVGGNTVGGCVERQGTHLGSEMDEVAVNQPLSSDQSNPHQSNPHHTQPHPVALSQSFAPIGAPTPSETDDYNDSDNVQSFIEHTSSDTTPNNHHHHHNNDHNYHNITATTNNTINLNVNPTTATATATHPNKLILSPDERVVLSRLRFTIDPYATRYLCPKP